MNIADLLRADPRNCVLGTPDPDGDAAYAWRYRA